MCCSGAAQRALASQPAGLALPLCFAIVLAAVAQTSPWQPPDITHALPTPPRLVEQASTGRGSRPLYLALDTNSTSSSRLLPSAQPRGLGGLGITPSFRRAGSSTSTSPTGLDMGVLGQVANGPAYTNGYANGGYANGYAGEGLALALAGAIVQSCILGVPCWQTGTRLCMTSATHRCHKPPGVSSSYSTSEPHVHTSWSTVPATAAAWPCLCACCALDPACL